MSKTTSKKDIFVDEYLKDFNQTKAAIRAGYSENGARTRGSLLMNDVYVKSALKNKLEVRKKQLLYDEQFVIESLKEITARCLQSKDDSEWSFDAVGALKALELLGKHIGMFNPKLQEVDTPTYPVTISIIQDVSLSE